MFWKVLVVLSFIFHAASFSRPSSIQHRTRSKTPFDHSGRTINKTLYDSTKGANDSSGIANKFLQNAFMGVTLPFPVLRRIVLQKNYGSDDGRLKVGISAREGLVALAIYLSLGVAAYHRLEEKWTIIDALYFSCVTFSTVGYGEMCPTNALSKIFTCIFGLSGIAFLGVAIAAVGGKLLEAETQAIKSANKKSIKRVMLLFEGMPDALKNFRKSPAHKAVLEKKEQARNELEYESEEDILLQVIPGRKSWLGMFTGFIVRSIPSLLLILGGGLIMDRLNSDYWSWEDSIYYSIVTASTIGFGDLTPKTQAAKLFAVAFIPVSVAAAGELLSVAGLAIVNRRQRELYKEQLEKELKMEHLKAMDTDGDGKITRAEYVHFMLIQMGRVSEKELNELYQQFKRLDVTKSGYLDNEDLKLMAKLRGADVK